MSVDRIPKVNHPEFGIDVVVVHPSLSSLLVRFVPRKLGEYLGE